MKIRVGGKDEFERFSNTVKLLMSVPHDEIKAALNIEKIAKKRKKAKIFSSSREKDGRA